MPTSAIRRLSPPIPVPPSLVSRVAAAARATSRAFGWAAAGVLSAIAVVHLLRVASWPFELLHHFLMAYAFAAAGLAICAFSGRALRLAVAACLLALFFAGSYARSADFFVGHVVPGTPISLITNNVYCRNWDAEGLRAWLATRPADIVALEEVPPHVERALAPLVSPSLYPYSARIPAATRSSSAASGCEGILLLSTVPIVANKIYQSDEKAWPALIAQLDVPGTGSAWLVLLHALDPLRPQGLLLRDELLATLAPVIAALTGPVIVAGDFNATPFTPVFRQFLADARLSQPPDLSGSYPANAGAFGLPIDHILLRDADFSAIRALPATGSDHRPLFAEIVLPLEASPPLVAAHPTGSFR